MDNFIFRFSIVSCFFFVFCFSPSIYWITCTLYVVTRTRIFSTRHWPTHEKQIFCTQMNEHQTVRLLRWQMNWHETNLIRAVWITTCLRTIYCWIIMIRIVYNLWILVVSLNIGPRNQIHWTYGNWISSHETSSETHRLHHDSKTC